MLKPSGIRLHLSTGDLLPGLQQGLQAVRDALRPDLGAEGHQAFSHRRTDHEAHPGRWHVRPPIKGAGSEWRDARMIDPVEGDVRKTPSEPRTGPVSATWWI